MLVILGRAERANYHKALAQLTEHQQQSQYPEFRSGRLVPGAAEVTLNPDLREVENFILSASVSDVPIQNE